MDLGGVYINKNKHSSDLEIASLHKALHDLQSYIHLILRIIGGLAGFTSDHISSELINELSKVTHDSNVQVLSPYKSPSTRAMQSVPQSYYTDSKEVDYSSQFNLGMNASQWSDVQYSRFFSNLAKSLPASSATDFRENHQLGLNRVVRPNPRKPPISLFTAHDPRRKNCNNTHSPEAKGPNKCVEINKPIDLNVYQSGKLYSSSENDTDYASLIPRNVPFADSTESTRAMHVLNAANERETEVFSKGCSEAIRPQNNSSTAQNQGYSHPSNSSSVDIGRFEQGTRAIDKTRKKLSNDLVICEPSQTKPLVRSQGSVNVSGDLALPEPREQLRQSRVVRLEGEPISLHSKESFDDKIVDEPIQSSNMTRLLKEDYIIETAPTKESQVKLVETNNDPPSFTVASHESLVGQQQRTTLNVTEPLKIALVDIKLLQENVSDSRPDITPFGGASKEISECNCLTFSENTLTRGHDNSCPHSLPAKIADPPLTSGVENNDAEKCTVFGTQVSFGDAGDLSLFCSTSSRLVSSTKVSENLSQCDNEQTKMLANEQQMALIKRDDGSKVVCESGSDRPRCLIDPGEPLRLAHDNIHIQPYNIIDPSTESFLVKLKEGKELRNKSQVKSGGCSYESDPAEFLNTALKSLTCDIDNKGLKLTRTVVEDSKPSDPKEHIYHNVEVDVSGKLVVEMSTTKEYLNANDHKTSCKIDPEIEVKSTNTRGRQDDAKNKQPISDSRYRSQKALVSKKCSGMPLQLDLALHDPTVDGENIQERFTKYKPIGEDLKLMLPTETIINLKLPDMPDLVDSGKLSLQNSSSNMNAESKETTSIKFANKVIENAKSLECILPECTELDSSSAEAGIELIPFSRSYNEVYANKLCNFETENEGSKKSPEDVDTSDTSSDDDSEGKLVIDISDAEHKPSVDILSSKRKFSHPKKSWRIKMLQDNNQINNTKTKIDALKVPCLKIAEDFLLSSLSNLSAGSTENLQPNKRKRETALKHLGTSGDPSAGVRYSQGKPVVDTALDLAGEGDSFKSISSEISSSNETVNTTEMLHDKLKHLPIEIQRGLRKRNEILMKYFRTLYPDFQIQGKPCVDSFDSSNNTDLRLSAVDRSFASPFFDNSTIEVNEESETNTIPVIKSEQSTPYDGLLDFSEAYTGPHKSKTVDSSTQNPKTGLNLVSEKSPEDRTSDTSSSFLNYILHGYSMSSEESSSQSATDLRKVNDSCSSLGSIGQRSLPMVARKMSNEQDYSPKEKRSKTDRTIHFDYDHRRRREKNNEASKRHRESKKKLQKEAFDNITKLEEINLRLRQKAEKLDSAVKQVLKVIATLSTNS